MAFHVPNEYRKPHPIFKSMGNGNNDFFLFLRDKVWFCCQASDGMGWEHVSISLSKKRCPTWGEMCLVKDLFWDNQDTVIQFHPAKNYNISMHNYCLHLWRSINFEFPKPDPIMVGIK